jgi:hypothetical protein
MNASGASWSQRADLRVGLLAATLAAALFFAAWGLLHHGFYARGQILDTPFYERHGDAVVDGLVPYRDFSLEYPPASLPVFVIPSLYAQKGDLDAYRRAFDVLMALCGAALAALVALVLVQAGARPPRLVLGVGLATLFPLALGSVVLSRYDLWPAALTAGFLAALLAGYSRASAGLLALAAAAKVYPVVLVPIAVVYVWRQAGRRAALVWLAIFAGVTALVVVPFLALSPGGVWHSIMLQVTRPLQLESLGAALLLAAHRLVGTGLVVESSHGSQNVAGAGSIAAVQSALEVAALLAIWIWFARGPAEPARLLRASAAAVCAFAALSKVLSPQFLIWLVPFVALLAGRRGLAAGALLLTAMILTQLWFPSRYWRLAIDLDARASWLVLVRDLVLVGLLGVLLWPESLRRAARAAPR